MLYRAVVFSVIAFLSIPLFAQTSESFQPLVSTILSHMVESPASLRIETSFTKYVSEDVSPCSMLRIRIITDTKDRLLLGDARLQDHLEALLSPHLARAAHDRSWPEPCLRLSDRVKIDVLDSEPEGPSPFIDPETFDSLDTLERILEIAVAGSADVTLDACRQLKASVCSDLSADESFQSAVRYFFYRAGRRTILKLIAAEECETYPTILLEFPE